MKKPIPPKDLLERQYKKGMSFDVMAVCHSVSPSTVKKWFTIYHIKKHCRNMKWGSV